MGPNREALESALKALASGPEHAALAASCRSLAVVVDGLVMAGEFNDRAWREYRLALKELMTSCTGGGVDEFTEWLATFMDGSSKVRSGVAAAEVGDEAES